MNSEPFELNDLLIELFPQLKSYINENDDEQDEIMASYHEVTVDYYLMEFKL